jgi:hypothetical protein
MKNAQKIAESGLQKETLKIMKCICASILKLAATIVDS